MILGLSGTSTVQAGEICAAKSARIQKQIDEAKKHNNTHQVAGLERALRDVNRYCDDNREYQQVRNKVVQAERNVVDAQHEINERQAEIREEQAKGDQRKVQKLQNKLASDYRKLREKQANLDALRAEQEKMTRSMR